MTAATPEQRIGRVRHVSGSIVDVDFADAGLPAINTALDVEWDGPGRLTLEIQQHLDPRTARCVAMQETAGLRCGVAARDTGKPILVQG